VGSSNAEEDEGGGCCVCGKDVVEEGDEILLCDGCNLAVHQSCYGVPHLPEDEWFCEPCQAQRQGGKRATATAKLRCPACPVVGGAFKRTLKGQHGGWAHAACTFYIDGPGFDNIQPTENPRVSTLEGAAGFERAEQSHPQLGPNSKQAAYHCSLCKGAEDKRAGLRVQCAFNRCHVAFHATCAVAAGCFVDLKHGEGGRFLYCKKHSEVKRREEAAEETAEEAAEEAAESTSLAASGHAGAGKQRQRTKKKR